MSTEENKNQPEQENAENTAAASENQTNTGTPKTDEQQDDDLLEKQGRQNDESDVDDILGDGLGGEDTDEGDADDLD